MRLREERLRLGMNQTDFAALAGASKGAQIGWEKDAASPNAVALIAFAEAGADVLYVLTGRRTSEGPELALTTIENDLANIRRALLEQRHQPEAGETADQAEDRVVKHQAEILKIILEHRDAIGSPEQIQEAENLLSIAEDPSKLTAFRAADHAQLRSKRKRIKERIVSYIEMNDQQPNEIAVNLMVGIALEHNVPIGPLVELAIELLSDPDAD